MSTPKIIAITSGKGGVGKTSLTINLGIALSQKQKICLFDADTNLANINIMLRLAPEFTLEQVIKGEKTVSEILLRKAGIDIVPGASGITDFVHLSEAQQRHLIQAITQLEQQYDYLLVDTSAGIHENVLEFIENAHQALVVITQEPTSLTDAFSLLRVLKKRGYKKAINVVVNSVQTELSARDVFNRFEAAVAKYIGYRVRYLGYVTRDANMSDAITRQNPILLHNPTSPASLCFTRLANNIHRLTENNLDNISLSDTLKKRAGFTGTPNFSIPKNNAEFTAARPIHKPGIDDYKPAIQSMIQDTHVSKKSLDDMFSDMLQAYEKRFNEYPFHPIDALNHYLELNRIPQSRLNDLLMTLQLFYQGKLSENEKESYSQYLRQLINSFVDQFTSYPFDVVYALYQYLDLETIPEQKLRELLLTLHLIYQDKYPNNHPDDKDANNLLYCAEQNTDDMERMISTLQEKLLHNLQRKIEHKSKPEITRNINEPIQDNDSDSILDSIRYASLTDE